MHVSYKTNIKKLTVPQTSTGDWANKIIRIINYWKSGELINEEAGQMTSSEVAEGALTAQWLLKPVAGINYFWIENKGKAGHRINVETGALALLPCRMVHGVPIGS